MTEKQEENVFGITISYYADMDINPPIAEYLPDIVYTGWVIDVIESDGRLINVNGTLRTVRLNDGLLFDFTDYVPIQGKGGVTEFKGLFYVKADYDVQKRRMIVKEANRFKYLLIKHPLEK